MAAGEAAALALVEGVAQEDQVLVAHLAAGEHNAEAMGVVEAAAHACQVTPAMQVAIA